MRAVLSVLVLVACSEPVAWEDLEWVPASSQDQGSICLIAGTEEDVDAFLEAVPTEPQDFQPGEPLLAVYGLEFDTQMQREIELTLEQSHLHFTGTATWEEPDPPRGQYLVSYGPDELFTTTLALDSLEAGEHTVRFADDTLTLTVPGTDRACLGAYPFGRDQE